MGGAVLVVYFFSTVDLPTVCNKNSLKNSGNTCKLFLSNLYEYISDLFQKQLFTFINSSFSISFQCFAR